MGALEYAGIAHLAAHGDKGEAHRAGGGIPRRPALARPCIGGMTVGSQALAIDPGLGDRIDHLIAGAAQHVSHHGGAGDLDQYHVIETDPIERVLQRQHPLNFVGFDHGHQHIGHAERCLAIGDASTGEPVGSG